MIKGLDHLGLTPGDITDVVNSHLHWDHAGGNTGAGNGGQVKPVFPGATYHVQRGELEFARRAGPRTRGSYRPEDFEPIDAAGRLTLHEGAVEVTPGVTVHPAPGHLPHMQVITITGRKGTVFFPADLIPTTHHLAPAWIMAYDVEPLRTLDTKTEWLRRAGEEGWKVVFYHDLGCPVATLEDREGRWSARPVAGG